MLRLRLLGAPSIHDDDQEVCLPSIKAQALLFYLAVEPDRSFARSQLVTLLWEESSEREGRNSLSTVLSRIRRALPIVPIRSEGDTLAWQSMHGVWVDLHEFRKLAQPSRPASLQMLDADIQHWEAAIGLYRGTFLDGFSVRDSAGYDEWLQVERERWQQCWLSAIEHIIDAYTVANKWSQAIEHARRAVVADPLQERFHRALMRMHYYAGDRAAAMTQFRLCREVLDRELGVEPDQETEELHRAIMENRLQRVPRLQERVLADHQVPSPITPSSRLATRLASTRQRSFVGRTSELALFSEALLRADRPFSVLHVYGPGGVGKSTLLDEFARLCGEAAVPVLTLDGRNLQPTPDEILNALRDLTRLNDPLTVLPERIVLLIDTYELLAPIDHWLREQLLPQLPAQALVVLAGRNPPSAGWRVDAGWQEISRTISLGNLSEADANDYLRRRNIPDDQHAAVLRFTRGYPLALSLAAEVLIQRPGSSFEVPPPPDVIHLLIERFTTSAPSDAHRATLEACSQVRVITEPLLAAMLGVVQARDLFAWLRDLSFVSSGPRGVFLHDLAREALATDLAWRNSLWHDELHQRARRFYMQEFERLSGHEQYMTLLDLIFLHDNPLLRSSFTWNEIGGVVEDVPTQDDWPLLVELVRRHEGDQSAQIATGWFARQPEGVRVFRDHTGTLSGFVMFITLRDSDHDLIDADPCVEAIHRYVIDQLALQPSQIVAVSRFWMDRDSYQSISPTQGMIFVASIRYVLTTPDLAYSFHVFADPEAWKPTLAQVFFTRLPEADIQLAGRCCGVFMRDWCRQPPQAWLAALAEIETQT